MVQRAVMNKVPEFPRPHSSGNGFSWAHTLEGTAVTNATIIPIIHYDEGLGVINSYKSNPQNTSFGEVLSTSCYPTSKINKIWCQLRISMTKGALETDKVHAIRFATMTIHTSFNEGALALDEISTLDVNEILELTQETTDRQTFPLYNNVSMLDGTSNAELDMPATAFGLTTSEIEAVAFNTDDYYDCLHYYTNHGILKGMQSGLKWHTLTRAHPTMTIQVHQNSKTKYMNPYAFLGVMVYVPFNATNEQYGKIGDTTADLSHLQVEMDFRYNEHNHEFNHGLQ